MTNTTIRNTYPIPFTPATPAPSDVQIVLTAAGEPEHGLVFYDRPDCALSFLGHPGYSVTFAEDVFYFVALDLGEYEPGEEVTPQLVGTLVAHRVRQLLHAQRTHVRIPDQPTGR